MPGADTGPKIVRFDCYEVDLAAGQLRKRGVRIRLREQPFQVLASLVERSGQVVTREELRQRLWPGDVFVDFENNLNTAIGRLREALDDSAEHPRFIETLPKHGYRFIGTISEPSPAPGPVGAPKTRRWRPAVGREVPGTPWVLEEKLGEGGFGEVWLARHRRLKEPRVFKFCVREDRVQALKREMTLFRVWRARVGDHPHLVQLLGVNLDQPPFYLEEEYVSGRDLRTWCAGQGGIGTVPVEVRLELVAQAAEGLAAAHEAGIIHRDIKPGNILVGHWRTEGGGGGTEVPTAKLTDFGIGRVVSAEYLAGITATGLAGTKGPSTASALMGTHAYIAPEVLMGRPATVQSDVYSMGVVLYQLLVEDFTQPVTTDWAREVSDAVLQEDLQRCFAGRPEGRFPSAMELAEHLRSWPARRDARAGAAGAAVGLAAAAMGTRAARLIVLPFVNLSGDPTQEYVSDAMTDEVITELSALAPRALAVIARTTAMRYKGSQEDVARIGRELNVDYVVEGAVRRAGDSVTINAQLVRASDQAHVWAKRYDVQPGDVFSIPDPVAQAIADALGISVRSRERAVGPTGAPKGSTPDPIAYNEYVQGSYCFDHLIEFFDGFERGMAHLKKAVARDQGFALAHEALAQVYWFMGYFGVMAPRDAFAAGILHAVRALEIDNTRAEPRALVAQYHKQLDYNWPDIERELAAALELDPASPLARMLYAVGWLMPQGRLGEAIAELERALGWDPLSYQLHFWLTIMLVLAHDWDRGIEQARLLIELEPTAAFGPWLVGVGLRGKGLLDESVAAHRSAVELSPGAAMFLGWFGLVLGVSGRADEARGVLERLEEMVHTRYVAPSSFAWIYLGLRDVDRAFEWLDRAVDARDQFMMPIKTYAFFDPIRADPRFAALLRRMNLEP